MITIDAYLENPCGQLSIPYWKAKTIALPDHMRIVHDSKFCSSDWLAYQDAQYFRLYHDLQAVKSEAAVNVEAPNCYMETAQQTDFAGIVQIINQSYTDLCITMAQLEGYTATKVYDENLWVLARDKHTHNVIGCAIADLDRETGEGILEWIQVLPEYRGQKIGQAIVNELLLRMQNQAAFATVSGQVQNITNPERVYRKCGFTGNDIWHILTLK